MSENQVDQAEQAKKLAARLLGYAVKTKLSPSVLSRGDKEVVSFVLQKLMTGMARDGKLPVGATMKDVEAAWIGRWSYRLSPEKYVIRNSGNSVQMKGDLDEIIPAMRLPVYSMSRIHARFGNKIEGEKTGGKSKKRTKIGSASHYYRSFLYKEGGGKPGTDDYLYWLNPEFTKQGVSFSRGYFYHDDKVDRAIESCSKNLPVRFFQITGNYGKRRWETSLECDFIEPFYRKTGGRTLIVEPNPFMVEKLSGSKEVAFLFLDVTISCLYLSQFPDMEVLCLDREKKRLYRLQYTQDTARRDLRIGGEMWQEEAFDRILMFWRDTDVRGCADVASALGKALEQSGRMHVYIPQKAVGTGEARRTLREGFPYDWITLFPSWKEDTAAKYKSFALLSMSRPDTLAQNVAFRRFIKAEGESGNGIVLYPHGKRIPVETLETSSKSLAWLWANGQGTGSDPEKGKRNTWFWDYSPEIRLWYSWSEKGGKGRCYYCAIPTATQRKRNPLERGGRREDFIQFTAKTKEKAEEKVAAVLRPIVKTEGQGRHYEKLMKLQDAIRADVIRNFPAQSGMSFKSYCFCYGDKLTGQSGFDPAVARSLCESPEFEKLHTSMNAGKLKEALDAVMDSVLKRFPTKAAKLSCWETLDVLLDDAVRRDYLAENPVKVTVDKKRDEHERAREVRSGLVKKTLTPWEERKIFDFLRPLAVRQGIYMACALRFWAGLRIQEILELTFADVSKIDHLEAASLRVGWMDSRPPRNVPCSTFLYQLIEERKKYLSEELKIPADKLKQYPLACGKRKGTSKDDDRESAKKPAALWSVRQATRRALREADIPKAVIQLVDESDGDGKNDLNDYHGDLPRMNFEFRCRQTCGMEEYEIDHILGRQPAETFARYYCDFDAPLSQAVLAKKLNRWECMREKTKADGPLLKSGERDYALKSDLQFIQQGVSAPMALCTDVTMETDPATEPRRDGFIRVTIAGTAESDIWVGRDDRHGRR